MRAKTTTYDVNGREVFSEVIGVEKADIDISGLDTLRVSVKGLNDDNTYYTSIEIPLLVFLEGFGSKINNYKLPPAPSDRVAADLEMRRLTAKIVQKDGEDIDEDRWMEMTELMPSDRSTMNAYTILRQYAEWASSVSNLRLIQSALDDLREVFAEKLEECEEQLKEFKNSRLRTHSQ